MSLKIFRGDDSALSQAICAQLINAGEAEGKVEIKRFSDGEERPQFQENIRESDVFIIQSTNPPAENWLRLYMMIDAARNASAKRITAVVPYCGYGRQDRKDRPRVPISAALFARFIREAGADHVLTMDLHTNPIEAYFGVPTDHLYARPAFVKALKELEDRDFVVFAPDAGAGHRAKGFAQRVSRHPVAHIHKERSEDGDIESMVVVGNIQPDQTAVLVDDMIDTAGTIIKGARAIKDQKNVKEIIVVAAHAIFSGAAVDRLIRARDEGIISKVYITDTIEHPPERKKLIDFSSTFQIISVAELFAEAIRRTHHGESISALFE